MATLHVMTGYIAFGKTTVAHKLATGLNAVLISADELYVNLYGRNSDKEKDTEYRKKIYDTMWNLIQRILECGCDVVADVGVWSIKGRKDVADRVKKLGFDVIFHNVVCDINTARERLILRNTMENSYIINIMDFDSRINEFEPVSTDEGYKIIEHRTC